MSKDIRLENTHMQNGLSTISVERKLEVIHELDAAGGTLLDYFLLIFLSCVIATFGLVLNSGAVIIGAMLIAPLMPTILRTALSLVRGDVRRLGNSLTILLAGTFLALVLSTLLGNLVSAGGLNFLEILPSEVTGRTQPTLFDLAVALAGGAAGAYALAQPRLSATLPGVAISTALMPPLCVVGIGVSQGSWEISWGALLRKCSELGWRGCREKEEALVEGIETLSAPCAEHRGQRHASA